MAPLRLALVRAPSPELSKGQRSFVQRVSIDWERACAQHRGYVDALRAAGLSVTVLPALAGHPDATFVEDAAVVLDRIAVMTYSATTARRGEGESLEPVLSRTHSVEQMGTPATLDGGDVLRQARHLYVGQTARTNKEGCLALERLALREGLTVTPIRVRGCLHLKTACSYLGDDTFVLNPDWVDLSAFNRHQLIEVDESEPFGANVLTLGSGRLLLSSSAPRTADRLQRIGFAVQTCEIDELEKAEAGLTCLSLIY